MEKEDLQPTWVAYKATGDISLRNDLVVHYRTTLRQVAARVGATLPAEVDREDLISYGVFGLMDAIEKFDLERGIKFETYAGPRIRGSIIDHLRMYDWVPRSIRSKARDLEKARLELEIQFGRAPEDEELAEKLEITMEELWSMQSSAHISMVSSLDQSDGDDEHISPGALVFDPVSNPEDLLDIREIAHLISRAISGMTERSKTIVTLYYIEEMTLAEIGKVLGVTESRVSQLQSKVLNSLHESLVHRDSVTA